MKRRVQSGTLAFLLAAYASAALGGETPARQRPKLAPELEPLFGIAMAAPPEFAASALLRLSSRVTEAELRREFIDMAFRLAAKAQNPVQLVAVPGTEADTREGNLASALTLKLDALSLQARAIEDMTALDAVRAREMFSALVKPPLTPATCEESLLPEVSPYYEALAAVVRRSFSVKERARGEHLAFATAMLSRASALAELAPAAHALTSLEWSRQQFEIALGAFSSSLDSPPLDSRSFLYFSKSIDESAAAIVNRAAQLGAAPDAFVEAYRKFLVAQMRGPRCADSGKPSTRILQMAQNTQLFGPAIRGEHPEIASEETTPEHVEGEMKVERFWQSGEAQRIYTECLKLRQAPNGVTLSETARGSREWARQLTDFLNALANWRPNDEATESDYYHQKAIVYQALLDLTPPGELSDRVMQNFVEFLKSSNLQQQNAVEWFWHARAAVERIRPNHPEQAAKLLAAYQASGNIVLMLEAMLNK